MAPGMQSGAPAPQLNTGALPSDPQSRIQMLQQALGELDNQESQAQQMNGGPAASAAPAQDMTPVLHATAMMADGIQNMQTGLASMEQTMGLMATDVSSSVDRIAQTVAQIAAMSSEDAKSEPIEIKQLDKLSAQLSKLDDTLKKMAETPEAPEKEDYSPILTGLQKVQSAVESIKIPMPKGGQAGGGTVQVAYLGTAGTGLIPVSATNPLPVTGGGGGGGGTQYADGAARGTATGTLMMVDDGTLMQSAKGDTSGRLEITGGLTNNNAAPSTTNVGALTAVATAASPSLTEGNQTALSQNLTGNLRVTLQQIGGQALSTGNGVTGAGSQRVTIASDNTPVAFKTDQTTHGTTDQVAADLTKIAGNAVSAGNGASGTGVQRVTIANDSTGTVRIANATTPTQSSVAGSATSVSLLASNANRRGATIVNESSAVLYLKLGATASTTSYSVAMAGSASAPYAYYEVPFAYSGAIDGIWASATGNARITEIA